MNNTTRNEQLSYIDDRGTKRYRPAYMLLTEELERNGRLWLVFTYYLHVYCLKNKFVRTHRINSLFDDVIIY